MQYRNREALNAILLGGLVAGAIDIGAASLISGRSLGTIMQVIAGGLLAKASFEGGMRTMLLGFLLQELMAILIATAYVLVAKALPAWTRRWIISGLGYGVIVFFVMNYAVLPLSAWKSIPHFTALKFSENMLAMLVFGLIVAFFARRLTGTAVSGEQRSAGAAA
jgi:uncharacterized membrane protein YagU involved in acid resistance